MVIKIKGTDEGPIPRPVTITAECDSGTTVQMVGLYKLQCHVRREFTFEEYFSKNGLAAAGWTRTKDGNILCPPCKVSVDGRRQPG